MNTLYNPLFADLTAFEAMSNGERRAAGRRARLQAATDGFPNKAGYRTIILLKGSKTRLTMFSA